MAELQFESQAQIVFVIPIVIRMHLRAFYGSDAYDFSSVARSKQIAIFSSTILDISWTHLGHLCCNFLNINIFNLCVNLDKILPTRYNYQKESACFICLYNNFGRAVLT